MIETSKSAPTPPEAQQSILRELQELRATGQAIAMTINGAAFIVEDGATYRKLVEFVDWLETVAAIREGLASVERGEGRPAEEVFEELRRKYDIPRQA